MDRQVFLDDAALGILLVRLLVLLHPADTFDDDLILVADDLENATTRALVTTGDHDDFVVFLDARSHHTTSGASEMIFMKRLPRSSRATGPKKRVPIGSR